MMTHGSILREAAVAFDAAMREANVGLDMTRTGMPINDLTMISEVYRDSATTKMFVVYFLGFEDSTRLRDVTPSAPEKTSFHRYTRWFLITVTTITAFAIINLLIILFS